MKIGIIGSGQLGRMMAIAAYPLGHEMAFTTNSLQNPCKDLGKNFISQENTKTIDEIVDFSDVITYESENTDIDLITKINKKVTVYPSATSLFISQHRGREKQLFDKLNIPCASYQMVSSLTELEDAVKNIGLPAILKTVKNGYDGKGQFFIKSKNELTKAWQDINKVNAILEKAIDFKRELSLIAVRDINGNCKYYPLVENIHHKGILRLTKVPAKNINNVEKLAQQYMQKLLKEMNHVGVLTIELFETSDNLLINEIAPRVHNSGHWSIDGARTSQFENHIRAITGSSLGDTNCIEKYSAMINIINKHGPIEKVLKTTNAKLHIYGKSEREGRKLGHINIHTNDIQELELNIKNLAYFLP